MIIWAVQSLSANPKDQIISTMITLTQNDLKLIAIKNKSDQPGTQLWQTRHSLTEPKRSHTILT